LYEPMYLIAPASQSLIGQTRFQVGQQSTTNFDDDALRRSNLPA